MTLSPSHPWMRLCALAFCLAAAEAAAAADPSVGITVDLKALDALPPAAANAQPPKLRPPAQPQVAAAPAVVPPAAPVAPVVKPPAAPQAVPRPQPAKAEAPAATLAPGRLGTVPFAKGQTDLPPGQTDMLNAVAAKLASDEHARLQLIAYASGDAGDALAAQRIALARAVAARAYLVAKGVPSVRMDVRALGDRNPGDGPADRVDLMIVAR